MERTSSGQAKRQDRYGRQHMAQHHAADPHSKTRHGDTSSPGMRNDRSVIGYQSQRKEPQQQTIRARLSGISKKRRIPKRQQRQSSKAIRSGFSGNKAAPGFKRTWLRRRQTCRELIGAKNVLAQPGKSINQRRVQVYVTHCVEKLQSREIEQCSM